MFIRKVTICSCFFILLLALGWRLEQTMNALRIQGLTSGTAQENYRSRSAAYAEPAPINMPFLPREYVRIVRKTILDPRPLSE
ncbi:hypothetical protein PUR_45530 [Paenibacillus sp. URB8-2]|nr:hypothetical protein PUR_45530 [Paenibacillus sp. URB8-2]